ncbi:MAG: hypothetical protein HY925_15425 [Elusimicrobia bacterium]|nr:hypothetical protein [Elusimicrobiota bacterium]
MRHLLLALTLILPAAPALAQSSSEDVNYEMVMADPDNVELSLKWAKKQIQTGDLKGASATLERVVTLRPNNAKARLLWAVVMYRLADFAEAERELLVLTEGSAPADVKSEAELYLKDIRNRQRTTHYNAVLTFGGGFDNNRNASPAGGKALVSGSPLQLQGTSERRDDFSYPFMGTLGISHDIRGGHKAFGSATMFQSEQILTKNLNIKAYSLKGGATHRSALGELTPTLSFDHIQLAQSTFLRSRGLDLNLTQKLSPQNERYFRAAYTYQDYVGTPQVRTAPERSGGMWEFGGGFGHWFSPKHRLAPTYTYTIKNAARNYNAYTRHAFGLDHTWLLGKGMFVMNSLTAGYDRYLAHDDFVSPQIRSDDNYRARSMFGAPLSMIYKPLKDFLGTVSYEYFHSNSNLNNYAYTNNKLSAMLTYSWGI